MTETTPNALIDQPPTGGTHYTCARCFYVNYLDTPELDGYCKSCRAFTGLSPWQPEDGDAKCQTCARANPVWWIQSEIWNAVMGSEAGVLCPCCFIDQAEKVGFAQRGAWQLYPPAEIS